MEYYNKSSTKMADLEIGFWIKGLPYVWVEGETIFDSQRFYLISKKEDIVVFDQNNKAVLFSRSFPMEKYTILPFPKECHLPRNYFQVFNDELTGDENLRIEGKNIEINGLDKPVPKNKITVISPLENNEVKIYHKLEKGLNFYCDMIYNDNLYRRVSDCIFSISQPIEPFVTYEDINFQLPYIEESSICSLKYVIHRGQCKLFLGELEFLTKYFERYDDTKIVIYPGGCPANHLWYLIQFFPNIKFISIDPEPCELYVEKFRNIHFKQKEWRSYTYLKVNPKTKKILDKHGIPIPKNLGSFVDYINSTDYRVYFIQDFMTIKLSHQLKGLENALYISDIRTQVVKTNTVYDIDIVWNLSQQYNWITILKPEAYLLKFRLPFHQPKEKIDFDNIPSITKKDFEYSKKKGIDFLQDYKNNTLRYLDGIINIQSFPGVSSTETRLEGTTLGIIEYPSQKEYEDKFMYYNLVRNIGFFENPLANKKIGFDHCGDCALEYRIWEDYANKYNKKVSIKWVKGLIDITGQYLFSGNHGHRFTALTFEKYKNDYKTPKVSSQTKKKSK